MSASVSTAQQVSTSGASQGAQSPVSVSTGKGAQFSGDAPVAYLSGKGANLTVNNPVDQTGELAAIGAVEDTLKALGTISQTTSTANAADTTQLASLAAASLAASQAQSANTSSGGQTDNNATLTKVIYIVAAALVAIFVLPTLFGKKS